MQTALLLVFLICALIDCSSSLAATKQSITALDYYGRHELRSARISPDGHRVAYVVTTPDRGKNRDISRLWLRFTDGHGLPRALSDGRQPVAAPSWSPDGRSIAFLSAGPSRNGPSGAGQVWLVTLSAGALRQITDLKEGVSAFQWSPDGTQLVCVSREESSNQRDLEPEFARSSDTLHFTHAFFKEDGRGYLDHDREHLWVVSVSSGASRQLTRGDEWNDTDPQWSPDGRSIAFVSDRTGHAFDGSRHTDIWVIPAAGGTPRKISNHGLTGWATFGFSPMHSAPHWSADGRTIAFLAQPQEEGPQSIWVAPSAGATPAREVVNYVDVDTNDFLWAKSAFYYISPDRGTWQAFRADASTGAVVRLTHGEHYIGGLDMDKSGGEIVYALNDFRHPSELYAADVGFRRIRQLTHLGDTLLHHVSLCALARTPFKASDGLPIDGFLAAPFARDPGRKYPMILMVHGGPELMSGFQWQFDMQLLCGRGFAVYYTNPRGSAGYGADFLQDNHGEWAGKAYTDIIAGLDAVLTRNHWIDSSRIAIVGGSYGGYMTNWSISHTHRFAAAITVAGPSDLVSLMGDNDDFGDLYSALGVDLYNDYSAYWQSSPVRYAKDVTTPTLILQGEADQRVPLEQAEEWFRALRHFNVPAEIVIFPREHHGSIFGYRPNHTVEAMNWIGYWLATYLDDKSTVRRAQNDVPAIAP